MRSAHTVDQVREAETALMARLPDGVLMQRAAAGVAYAVLDLLGHGYGARVLLLVGAGNNGGDALYAGALLARRGVLVHALLLDPDRAHAEGLAALRQAGGRVVDAVDRAPRPDVVVDGIVGIGGSGGLRADAARVVAALAGVPVLAVDTPSGVEVDTGRVDGPHVRADVTVTFGTHKVAHLVDPAAMACGAVHLVDLGLDLPAPVVDGAPGARRAPAAAAAGPGRPQVHPRRGRGARRLRAVPGRRGALRLRRRDAGWSGWSATSAGPPTWSASSTRRWSSARAACRPG